MLISSAGELEGIQKISEAVATTLKQMRAFAKAGMTAKELDDFGGEILNALGAKSAPKLTYGFPGWTCICVNHEVAHGIPSAGKVFKDGDLINIDVSAELNGFWSDNGGSFILGEDANNHQKLVSASKNILHKAIYRIKSGVKVSDIGHLIEIEARKAGYRVIKNLAGHGVGRSLHEDPHEILNWCDNANKQRFRKNTVVAVETFISTASTIAQKG
ncbi:MAG: type I methionyl aminopeptidase, partial [Dyadobacter sp.]